MVVAGADVHVAAHRAALATHEERELRMNLQVVLAEDDVDAGALERARPFDVAPLVEARLELDEAQRLLVLFRSLHERGERRR